ncbi:hypothetical protein [Piscibacillus salipiscarius]|uniref:Uncharacterized protein n=1 Tax=Piscibacillus salipiscarius TaxID=299480 RepID=A0ABW5QB83_9BACI
MRKAILLIFWGLLIVFLDFRLNEFDVLMDPLGYVITTVGFNFFANNIQPARTAQIISILLAGLVIPEMFVDPNATYTTLGLWNFYFLGVTILSIVLAYYIFLLLIELADQMNRSDLKRRTEKTMKAYLVIMFFIALLNTFSINVSHLLGFIIILAIAGLITQIVFLVLIFKFRTIDETDHQQISMEG